MAGHNRHLRGATNEFLGDVRGDVFIEPGDLCYVYDTGGVAGLPEPPGRTGDGYVYPLSCMTSASSQYEFQHYAWLYFAGVALSGSASGVTNKVTVATAGEFRFPLAATANVTQGVRVSSVSAPTDQTVVVFVAAAGTSSTVGMITKSESGATYVDFRLLSRFSDTTRPSNA